MGGTRWCGLGVLLAVVGATAARGSVSAGSKQGTGPDWQVDAIVEGALERSALWEANGLRWGFCYFVTQETRTYDGRGDVIEETSRGYAVEPVGERPYYRVISRNDRPIDTADVSAGRARRRKFVEEYQPRPVSDRRRDGLDREHPQSLVVNEDLLLRYRVTLAGEGDVVGRAAWVLEFEPREGRQPVRGRMDHALNNARGELWVDQRTYEVARVNFQLLKPVRWWWGLLGSISAARGQIERREIAENVWMPVEVDVYFDTRILFRTTRQGERMTWRGFRSRRAVQGDGAIDMDEAESWAELSETLCHPEVRK